MFCNNCGKQLADDARFCDGCGTLQVTEQPPVEQPVQQTLQQGCLNPDAEQMYKEAYEQAANQQPGQQGCLDPDAERMYKEAYERQANQQQQMPAYEQPVEPAPSYNIHSGYNDMPLSEPSAQEEPKKKKKLGWLWGLLIGIVAIVGVLLVLDATNVVDMGIVGAKKPAAAQENQTTGTEYLIAKKIVQYDADGNESRSLTVQVNDEGMPEKATLKADGEKNIITFAYDEDGNVIRMENQENGAALEYEWEDGKLVKQIYIDKDGNETGSTAMEWDGDLLIKETDRGEDGSRVSVTNYEYDENGELTREEYIDFNDAKSSYEYTYENTYDGDRLTKQVVYLEGELNCSYEYEYDEDGNVVRDALFDDDGDEYRYFEYEYDSDGNLLKQVGTQSDKSEYVRYEFEYEDGRLVMKYGYYKGRLEQSISYSWYDDTVSLNDFIADLFVEMDVAMEK